MRDKKTMAFLFGISRCLKSYESLQFQQNLWNAAEMEANSKGYVFDEMIWSNVSWDVSGWSLENVYVTIQLDGPGVNENGLNLVEDPPVV